MSLRRRLEPTTVVNRQRIVAMLPAVALAVALVSLGVAGWALIKGPATDATGHYTDEQRTQAKRTVCDAYAVVRAAIPLNTNLHAPGGEGDVTGALAVVANARLALFAGGDYLLSRLEPATAPDLAAAVRTFSKDITDVALAQMAGAKTADEGPAAKLKEADAQRVIIDNLCKS